MHVAKCDDTLPGKEHVGTAYNDNFSEEAVVASNNTACNSAGRDVTLLSRVNSFYGLGADSVTVKTGTQARATQ